MCVNNKMKFLIDFNDTTLKYNPDDLKLFGAYWEYNEEPSKYGPDGYYYIDIETLEDMKTLNNKTDEYFKTESSNLIIFFGDSPSIFLEN